MPKYDKPEQKRSYKTSSDQTKKYASHKASDSRRDTGKSFRPSRDLDSSGAPERRGGQRRDNDRPFGAQSFGDKPYNSERSFNKPERSFNRPERSSDRPERSFNRPERSTDRPARTFGSEGKPAWANRTEGSNRNSNSSGAPEKRWGQRRDNDRPFAARPSGDRPFGARSFGDKPYNAERSFNKPERSFDRPNRSFNRPERSTDRPARTFGSEGKPAWAKRSPDSSGAPEKRWGQRRDNDKPSNPERSASRPEQTAEKPVRAYNDTSRTTWSSRSPGRTSTRPTGGQGRGKTVKKFNPSDFIKKVEEQVISAAYVPKHAFSDFLVEEQVKQNIIKRGYTTPTPIQDQTIPLLLEGKDVIGTANTGTGKTAAFLIPLVNNLLTKKTSRVLIITPTRELAAQIQAELEFFKAGTGFSSVLCIGGLSINLQINVLKRDPEFVIGTPGRLKDLEQNRHLNLSKYNSIVLDEVDTMLDMGFINDMKYILSRLPENRHSLFFSATISPEIKMLMNQFLRNPVSISVKTRQTAENVNQDIIKVNPLNKIEVLHDLLIKPEFTKVIIFVRTKRSTDKLSKNLRERGFKIATMHGDKSQAQRKKALAMFKDNHIKILLATDVVARGIDIDDVSHVINYDLPQTHEDYIHRIGRTGRANKVGQALTFIE
jgi:ATP-dependent RNA helicase RhlE